MDHSTAAARALMGDSLGFHIIFALLGVGLPLAISMIEFWSIRKKDANLHEAARRLSAISLVLVVAGVVSGTIIAVQMSLMWSGLVAYGGPIMGLAFLLEGYAFLLEAIFLAFYVGTWNKIKGYKHWLLGLPTILGSLLSAVFITSANAWMQTPMGFKLVGGKIVDPKPWSGILTKTTFFMASHSIVGYYLTTFLIILGGYAWWQLRHKPSAEQQKTNHFIMVRFAITTVISIVAVSVLGHLSLQYLAKAEPRKFAAIEHVQNTGTHAPYVVGPVKVPNGLSLLTGYSPNTEVPGLNSYPKETWPMLFIDKLFEIKMLLVGFIAIVPIGFLVLYAKRHKIAFSKPVLWALVVSGPISVIVVELGWLISEFGRQPYAVNGLLLTKDAYNHNPAVIQWGEIFPTMYLILFVVTILALRVTIKRFTPIKGAKK